MWCVCPPPTGTRGRDAGVGVDVGVVGVGGTGVVGAVDGVGAAGGTDRAVWAA